MMSDQKSAPDPTWPTPTPGLIPPQPPPPTRGVQAPVPKQPRFLGGATASEYRRGRFFAIAAGMHPRAAKRAPASLAQGRASIAPASPRRAPVHQRGRGRGAGLAESSSKSGRSSTKWGVPGSYPEPPSPSPELAGPAPSFCGPRSAPRARRRGSPRPPPPPARPRSAFGVPPASPCLSFPPRGPAALGAALLRGGATRRHLPDCFRALPCRTVAGPELAGPRPRHPEDAPRARPAPSLPRGAPAALGPGRWPRPAPG